MITIELGGFEELANQMAGMAQSLRSDVITKATLAAAKAVESELMQRTPINTDDYSSGSDRLAPGELLGDIDVRPLDPRNGVAAFAVGPGPKTRHVARFVEGGHIMQAGKGKLGVKLTHKATGTTFVPAKPFIRPAQTASEAAALEAFEATLESELIK